jgi:hypothetical protein
MGRSSLEATLRLRSDKRETPGPDCPTGVGRSLVFGALDPGCQSHQASDTVYVLEMKASNGPATLTFDPAPIGIYHQYLPFTDNSPSGYPA